MGMRESSKRQTYSVAYTDTDYTLICECKARHYRACLLWSISCAVGGWAIIMGLSVGSCGCASLLKLFHNTLMAAGFGYIKCSHPIL